MKVCGEGKGGACKTYKHYTDLGFGVSTVLHCSDSESASSSLDSLAEGG